MTEERTTWKCCKPACQSRARWVVRHGPSADDYTHTCDEHLPDMCEIEPAPGERAVTVWSIARGAS